MLYDRLFSGESERQADGRGVGACPAIFWWRMTSIEKIESVCELLGNQNCDLVDLFFHSRKRVKYDVATLDPQAWFQWGS
jgi:hypothetical protein